MYLELEDGDKELTAAEKNATIVDTVTYEGLTPGKEYTLSGILMDKSTGNPLLVDGKQITAETTFVPETANGEVQMEFTFDGSSLGGKEVVVFEKVLYNGFEVAVHADIEDEGQTVTIKKLIGKITPRNNGNVKTGDNTNIYIYVGIALFALMAFFASFKKKSIINKLFTLIMLFTIVLNPLNTYAMTVVDDSKTDEGNNIYREVSYTTANQDEEFESPNIIEENNVLYYQNNIDYKVISREILTNDKDIRKTILSDVMDADNEFTPDEEIVVDGTTLYLSDINKKEIGLESTSYYNKMVIASQRYIIVESQEFAEKKIVTNDTIAEPKNSSKKKS